MFTYSHPLITQGAGRIKTDPVNEQRVNEVLDRYELWTAQHEVQKNPLQYQINKEQLMKSWLLFPAAGAAIGMISSLTFVHPNSRYIGKFFTLFTTYLGYRLHLSYEQAYKVSRYFGNFPVYPRDIQNMIDNNDARYAYRWLEDGYMSIPKE